MALAVAQTVLECFQGDVVWSARMEVDSSSELAHDDVLVPSTFSELSLSL